MPHIRLALIDHNDVMKIIKSSGLFNGMIDLFEKYILASSQNLSEQAAISTEENVASDKCNVEVICGDARCALLNGIAVKREELICCKLILSLRFQFQVIHVIR